MRIVLVETAACQDDTAVLLMVLVRRREDDRAVHLLVLASLLTDEAVARAHGHEQVMGALLRDVPGPVRLVIQPQGARLLPGCKGLVGVVEVVEVVGDVGVVGVVEGLVGLSK